MNCAHVEDADILLETVPIESCVDPKRIRGKVWRNKIGDPIGCLKCDRVYVWSLPSDALQRSAAP